jgi:hypothetical protein
LRQPQLLGLNTEATLMPRLRALARRLALETPELRKVVVAMPPVLSYSWPKMASTLDRLQAELRLSDDELRRVVLVLPSVRRRLLRAQRPASQSSQGGSER